MRDSMKYVTQFIKEEDWDRRIDTDSGNLNRAGSCI